MNILTSNPDVWKKTIFILTYDENDGYFDHVPPFVAPHPRRPETGLVSAGINSSVDYVDREEELKLKRGHWSRESSIGLGYRVPMIIASPWSRGGCVCSQVFDHTSVLQFLERLLTHKTGRKVEEPNISQWRRTVCGDLTSSFQPYNGPESGLPPVADRSVVIEGIHRAKFKSAPTGFKALTQEEIDQISCDPQSSPLMTRQEPGIRRSSPLPYELFVDGNLNNDRTRFGIRLEARNQQFGERAAGSPFVIYAEPVAATSKSATMLSPPAPIWKTRGPSATSRTACIIFAFTDPTDSIANSSALPTIRPSQFDRLAIAKRRSLLLSGNVAFDVANRDAQQPCSIEFHDNAYRTADLHRSVEPAAEAIVEIDTKPGLGWYDLSVRIDGKEPFRRRYAGRVETGLWSYSDPAMGRVVGQVPATKQANNDK